VNKKLGYYTVAGKEFESKFQAMMLSQFSKKPLTWHFNDEVFDNYTWTVEPELTLDQLYDQRARQIREQYDYVILAYSGGSDSNNILESFIRQGLLIDEIVTNWALDASEKFLVYNESERSSWNINAEFKLNCVERLNYIRKVCPQTKITVNDTSRALVDAFLTADDASWIQDKKEVVNANGTNNYNFTYFKEIRKRFDQGKSIALVLGVDKPRLRITDDQLHLFFIDKIANIISCQEHIRDYPNAHPVYFYWDPDSCDILCKQGHMVLQWLKINPQYRYVWESTNLQTIRQTQEELMRSLLYTTWDSNRFQVKKSINDWDSELDYWFSRGWQGTREHKIWKDGLDYIKDRIEDFVRYNDDRSVYGTVPMFSKPHLIGSVV
jgi:hypothetical protein